MCSFAYERADARAPLHHTLVLCVRSKQQTPPGLTLCSEAAAALETAAVILLIHMLLLKKIDWGSELSRTRGDHRLLSLFCGGERVRGRARASVGAAEENAEEDDGRKKGIRAVIDFNCGSAFLKYSPGLRGCPRWLILGLARALLNPQLRLETG